MHLDLGYFLLKISNYTFAILMIIAKYNEFIDVQQSALQFGIQWQIQQLIYQCYIDNLLAHYLLNQLNNYKPMKQEDQAAGQLQLLLTSIRQIDQNLMQEEISNRVVLLMGQTKAGKTTLFYYLEGKSLVWRKNEIEVWQLRPQVNYMNAYIGNGYESTTVYPNIAPFVSQNDVMVIDMPGFDDSRHHYRLLNIYIMLETFKRLKQVHICHVIPQQCCESSALVQEFVKIINLFNKEFIFSNNCYSFILNKVENEELKNIFAEQIDDLVDSHLISNIEELKSFKAKNMFEVYNKQAIIEQGLQLRKRIQTQNNFFDTNHQPSRILSPQYSDELIGKSRLQGFQDYLIQIIEDIARVIEPLLNAYINIFLFEFQTILQLSTDQIKEAQEQIIQYTHIINLYQLQKFTFKANKLLQPQANHFIILLKIMKNIKQGDEKLNVVKSIHQFSFIISGLIKNGPSLEVDYLNKIYNCFKELGSLITIIMQVNLEQVKKKIAVITMNESLLNNIKDFNKFLLNKQEVIINSNQLIAHSQNDEIIRLMKELNIQAEEQQQQIIEKVYRYSIPLYNKQIQQIKFKHTQKIKSKNRNTNRNSIPIESGQPIQNLSATPQSLRYLKALLQQSKQKQKEVIKIILDKISQIFYWFSFFEEAIMFKMAIMDQNGICDLIDEAFVSHQLSKQFVRDILVPYYSKINCNISQLQICFNYLSNMTLSVQQKIGIQIERAQQINQIINSPQNYYLLLDRYKALEFYFINSILQNFEYYLQRIVVRQEQFNRSPVSSLTSFINNKMKQ